MKELYEPAGIARRPAWISTLGWVSLLFLAAAQVVAFMKSPADSAMGHLQKIMYVHVPAAWVAFLAFFVVFVMSIMYLVRRRPSHDLVAAACAEVGVVLTGLALALGSIWGRPTWGVWWTWDARLTSTAIMFLMYIGYLAMRGFADDEEQRARWSAAIGIIAFLNVPIVWWSVQWWSTLHQPQSTRESMSAVYWNNLWLNAVAFLLVFIFLVASRFHVAQLERAVELRVEADLLEGSEQHV
jgi:heme exporter protein C